MTWYVRIKAISGRLGYVALAEDLNRHGSGDRAYYYAGGWNDNMVGNVAPHLKFEYEDDAIAYVLACGGTPTQQMPIVTIEEKE